MIKISILIPIFNGLEYTKICLDNIQKQIDAVDDKKIKFNILIIDDGSTDGSSEWIKNNFPKVIVLQGTGHLWWSGAMNMGIRFAIENLNTDFILWWNNDIESTEHYFNSLAKICIDYNPNLITGSKIYLSQEVGKVWSMGGEFNPINGYKEMKGGLESDNPGFFEPQNCDWLPGMGTFMHKSVYKSIGLVDDNNFPQYHGDSDFTYRAKLAGYIVQVNPKLILYNDAANSGLRHDNSFPKLMRSLFSVKSNFNIKKNIIFYGKYAKSLKAYGFLLKFYFTYIGGFFKWKLLGLLGKQRN